MKIFKAAALATAFVSLAACAQLLVIPPHIAEGSIAHPTGFEPTLLARYYRVSEEKNDDGAIVQTAGYHGIRYEPRSSDITGFVGWDVLEAPSSDSSSDRWLYLVLNRPADVVIVWDEFRGWLRGWQSGPDIDGTPTYRRSFSAGQVVLGSPGEGNGTYTVLIAERGGSPSDAPPLPAGISVADTPIPNQTCPSWVHDLYQSEGPNGQMYLGWHPQIDPVYWCYFGHEHGADPALIGYGAAFRYIADQNNNQQEQHEGFKGYAMFSENGDYGWYVNIHATTSAISRTCAQTHTVVIAVVDQRIGQLVAELGYKGDFGSVMTTEERNGQHLLIQPTFNPNCADQASILAQTSNVKMVRVHDEPGIGSGGYERWRGGLTSNPNTNLGISFRGDHGMSLDIQNPLSACHTLTCDYGVSTGSNGTRRHIRFRDVQLQHSQIAILDGADGTMDGVFYTNQYGDTLVTPDHPNAVRQFIAPGLDVTLNGGFSTEDAWRTFYSRQSHTTDFELEGSISSVN